MASQRNRIPRVLTLFTVALFGATIFFRLRLDLITKETRYSLTPPPPGLKYFAFGFNEALGDCLWLRYIQDLEKCNLQGKQGETKPACAKGWSFQMLDQITDLAPRFRMPYAVGPVTLSVLVDDYDGAAVLFEKAIKAFPDDWPILYRAAYFYLHDKKDERKAASLLLAAHERGGPYWLPMLASKLYSHTGQLELGITTLEAYLKQVGVEDVKKVIKERLEMLYCERSQLAQGATEIDEEACKRETRH